MSLLLLFGGSQPAQVYGTAESHSAELFRAAVARSERVAMVAIRTRGASGSSASRGASTSSRWYSAESEET